MGTEAIPINPKLNLFFFPYVSSGHFFPLLNMAILFANSHPTSVSCTIITTPSNTHLITPSPNLSLLTLPLPSTLLPQGWDSTSFTSTHAHFQSIQSALALLYESLLPLLKSLDEPPHCLISDMFLPWTVDLAAELGIPRIVFHGMSSFSLSAIDCIKKYRPQESVCSDDEPFVVPGLPKPVMMARSQLPDPLRVRTGFNSVMEEMDAADARSYGVIVNSFCELEGEFAGHYRNSVKNRAWFVGPVSVFDGNRTKITEETADWLDSKDPGSVLYVCFGSLTRFSEAQFNELAHGLMSSNHYFIWIVKKDDPTVWIERDPENKYKKGLVIRGWASQVQILNHEAVGGFLTHCGWNSVLEGVSAGKPMVTWPVFGDQPFNERLIVNELKIGVRVGARVGSEELVKNEKIARAVEMVMGEGEAAAEMKRKAKVLGKEAISAVKEGGSSWNDMNCLIRDLMSLHEDSFV